MKTLRTFGRLAMQAACAFGAGLRDGLRELVIAEPDSVATRVMSAKPRPVSRPWQMGAMLTAIALMCSVYTESIHAQQVYKAFAGTSAQQPFTTNALDTMALYIAPALNETYAPAKAGVPGSDIKSGVAVLDFLIAKTDKASTFVYSFSCGPGQQLFQTNNLDGINGTTNYTIQNTGNVNDPTNWPINSPLILRHVSTETYEWNRVGGVNSTNLIFTNNPAVQFVAGDIAYLVSTNGSLPISSTTTTWQSYGAAGGILNGLYPGRPFAVGVVYTSAGSIQAASGHYMP